MNQNIFLNKKILIFKKEKYSNFYDPIINSIIKIGKPKKIFYVKYKNFNNAVKINLDLFNKIKKNKIDIFLAASYFIFNTNYLNKIRELCKTIRLDGDDDTLLKSYSLHISNFFDLNLTMSPTSARMFEKYGNKSSVIPVFYKKKKIKSIYLNYDVSFVGLLRGKSKRLTYIKEVKKNQIPLNLFGPDTTVLNYNKVLGVFSNSKINLNFSQLNNDMPIINAHDKNLINRSGVKGRLFEVLRCGGFLLTEYTKDLSFFFKIKRHLEVFKNKKELIKKIKYYLKNEKKRKLIAKNGKKYFDQNFSEEVYSKKLINLISFKFGQKKLKRKSIIRKNYMKNYNEFFSYYISKKDLFLIFFYYKNFKFLLSNRILFLRIKKKLMKILK